MEERWVGIRNTNLDLSVGLCAEQDVAYEGKAMYACLVTAQALDLLFSSCVEDLKPRIDPKGGRKPVQQHTENARYIVLGLEIWEERGSAFRLPGENHVRHRRQCDVRRFPRWRALCVERGRSIPTLQFVVWSRRTPLIRVRRRSGLRLRSIGQCSHSLSISVTTRT